MVETWGKEDPYGKCHDYQNRCRLVVRRRAWSVSSTPPLARQLAQPVRVFSGGAWIHRGPCQTPSQSSTTREPGHDFTGFTSMTGCETRFANFSRKGKSHGQHNFDSRSCRRALCYRAWRSGTAPPHSRQVTQTRTSLGGAVERDERRWEPAQFSTRNLGASAPGFTRGC